MSSNVLFAVCIDAFVASHNNRRLGIPGTVEQHFEARLRVTARRHRVVANAWRSQAVVFFSSASPSSSSLAVQDVSVAAGPSEPPRGGRHQGGSRGRWHAH
eukprot:7356917-Pyramimonas_sp.AAC.1